jgi:AcrR family transcriptional regulator
MVIRVERSIERRQEIVDAAMHIADRKGLDAVSMRRVADALGVGTMTLYSYVAGKEALLALMRDEVSRAMLVPEPLPEDWREALREIARRTNTALSSHEWVLRTLAHPGPPGLNTLRHIEQSLRAVDSLAIDDEVKGKVLMAVDDYVIGHTIRARVRRVRGRGEAKRPRARLTPEGEAALAAGELPALAARLGAGVTPGAPPEGDFELGLEWLLDGIEASVAARGGVR